MLFRTAMLYSLLLLLPIAQPAVFGEERGKATFAGGCLWCMEHPFEKMDGVLEVISGYTGGRKKNPKYDEVSSGVTDHRDSHYSKKPTEKYRKPMKEELRKKLTPLQYRVTQENGTEKPFENEYWNNDQEGIYVDIVSGEALFSSTDKYKSGTGWPSFTRPLEPGNIVELEDRSLFSVRTEVKSKNAGSHLGHVFEDGPPPTGLRYCLNSAALRFIPKENLEKEGYGQYMIFFEK